MGRYSKEAFYKAADAAGYEIVTDTKGTLLWNDSEGEERPLLILTSEQVSKEYLAYLESRHISWIACGKERIDLACACEILAAEFGVERMAVVGGGHINAGFLAAGLLDEVSILMGAGIDGRGGMAAVFDGLPENRPVTPLKLTDVNTYESYRQSSIRSIERTAPFWINSDHIQEGADYFRHIPAALVIEIDLPAGFFVI